MIKLKRKDFKVIDDERYYNIAKEIVELGGMCIGMDCKECPLHYDNLMIDKDNKEILYEDDKLTQDKASLIHLNEFIKYYEQIQKEKHSIEVK